VGNIEREVAAALLREYGWEPRIVGVGDPSGYEGWERIARTALEAANHQGAVGALRDALIETRIEGGKRHGGDPEGWHRALQKGDAALRDTRWGQ
jgi:hypothetical protein